VRRGERVRERSRRWLAVHTAGPATILSDERIDYAEARYQNVGDSIKGARLKSTYSEGVEIANLFQGVGAFEIAFDEMEKDL
jgi:hypothetical protein